MYNIKPWVHFEKQGSFNNKASNDSYSRIHYYTFLIVDSIKRILINSKNKYRDDKKYIYNLYAT